MTADFFPVVCPGCQKQFKGSARLAGRQVKCPACQTVITVPPLAEAEPVQANEADEGYAVAPSASWTQPTYGAGSYGQDGGGAMAPSGLPQYSPPPLPAAQYAPPAPPETYYAPPGAPEAYYQSPAPNPMAAAGYSNPSAPQMAPGYYNRKKGSNGSATKIIAIVVGAVVLIGLVAVALTLINSRSEETERKIVGRWQMEQINGNVFVSGGNFGIGAQVIWDFRADNTVVISVEGGFKPGNLGKGKWTASSKILSITLDEGSKLVEPGEANKSSLDILHVDPKQMELQQRNRQGDKLTFKRNDLTN
jgi:hypothetical protein